MAKVSRPIIYVAVLGAVAYAAVVLTEPDQPPAKSVRRTATATVEAPKGFTAEDLKADFPRYKTTARDAFLPKVVSSRSAPGASVPSEELAEKIAKLSTGVWMLTGITSVNGVRSALLENGAAGDSVFLKAGDIWNGLRVAEVEQSAVVMVSPEGKKSRFGFPAFDESAPPAPVPVMPVVPVVPGGAPGLTSGDPLTLPTPSGFRGRRGPAPLVAEPIPVQSQASPAPPRAIGRANSSNTVSEMLSSASDTRLAEGAEPQNPNE